MIKRFAVLSILILSWTIIGARQSGPAPSANAYALSTAIEPRQHSVPASANVTWEYRILLDNSFRIASLESAINKLTEQGYIVETFQPVSSVNGGGGSVNSATEIYVLLRRIRK